MPVYRRFWSTDRGLSLLLASVTLLIFVIRPVQETGVAGRLLIPLFFSFILISGVAAVAQNRLATAVVGSLVIMSLLVRCLRLWRGGELLEAADAVVTLLFCATLAVVVLVHVTREGPVTAHRIQGAVAVYLLLGLAWASAYEFIALQRPDAFLTTAQAAMSPHEDPTARFVYFSFVTLTTVGYGDFVAVHPFARSLVILEALVGQLFPVILLTRLVSLELAERQAK